MALLQPVDVPGRTCAGKIVEDGDISAPGKRAVDEIAADEARATGDQHRLGQGTSLRGGKSGVQGFLLSAYRDTVRYGVPGGSAELRQAHDGQHR